MLGLLNKLIDILRYFLFCVSFICYLLIKQIVHHFSEIFRFRYLLTICRCTSIWEVLPQGSRWSWIAHRNVFFFFSPSGEFQQFIHSFQIFMKRFSVLGTEGTFWIRGMQWSCSSSHWWLFNVLCFMWLETGKTGEGSLPWSWAC